MCLVLKTKRALFNIYGEKKMSLQLLVNQAQLAEKAVKTSEVDTAEEVFEAVIGRSQFLQVNRHVENGSFFFTASLTSLEHNVSLEDGTEAGELATDSERTVTMYFVGEDTKQSINEIVSFMISKIA